ncbi:hypothetical protein RhiirB3_454146 [Rhizophagus irregularis]|nr:hypothetical protein RhiirB3_454146 [Rhizophagus irregularis]
MIITLFCLIEGNPADNYAFSVKIDQTEFVSDLKKKIRENKPNDFASIDSNNITLWQTDIPDEADAVIRIYWPETPSEQAIHVIIELPQVLSHTSINNELTTNFRRLNIAMDKELTTEDTSYEGADAFAFISKGRLGVIDQALMRGRVVLLRSSPSGKTTLAYLLKKYLQSRNPDEEVISISMLLLTRPEVALSDVDLFDQYWTQQTGKSWSECIGSNRPITILIDEAQMIYPYADEFFWNSIKVIMDPSHASDVVTIHILLLSTVVIKIIWNDEYVKMAILLGSYLYVFYVFCLFLFPKIYAYHCMYDVPKSSGGNSTPITFSVTLGLDYLRLNPAEYAVFLEKFINATQHEMHFKIEEKIKKVIYKMSRSYAGILRGTLNQVKEQYRNGVQTTSELLKYLILVDFQNFLTSTRSFIWLHNWNPSNEESHFLRNALNTCDKNSMFHVDMDILSVSSIVNKYIHSGLIAQTKNGLQFVVPLMQSILGFHLYSVPYNKRYHLLDDTSFEEFLLRSLERMRPSVLKSSLNVTIRSNIGGLYGTNSYLNFFVNGDLRWGIEILREGTDMTKYATRFGPNDDYTKFIVKRLGEPDELLVLRGDID